MMHGNSLYTDELADSMIAWVSEGKTLRSWCRENGVSNQAVYAWKRVRSELERRFIEAREAGADAIVCECIDIADTPIYLTRTEESENGKKITTYDAVERSKLMIWAREQHIKRIIPVRAKISVDVESNAVSGLFDSDAAEMLGKIRDAAE